MARTVNAILLGSKRLNLSTNGNPRFRLFTDQGDYLTSSDAAVSYDVENYTRGASRGLTIPVTLSLTRAGRVDDMRKREITVTEYDVVMRHDTGRITIRTAAASAEDAARNVCAAEGAPSRSVVSVALVESDAVRLPDGAFSMDDVVSVLRTMKLDAYVEMTGGGVATIYAGTQYRSPEDDGLYPAVAGPGTYQHRDYGVSVAHFSEFVVGPDYSEEWWEADVVGALTVQRIAELIALQVAAPNGERVSADAIREAGFSA